jgi:hypothetical protein
VTNPNDDQLALAHFDLRDAVAKLGRGSIMTLAPTAVVVPVASGGFVIGGEGPTAADAIAVLLVSYSSLIVTTVGQWPYYIRPIEEYEITWTDGRWQARALIVIVWRSGLL